MSELPATTDHLGLPRAAMAPPRVIRPAAHRNGRLTERGRQLLRELEDLVFAEGFTEFTIAEIAARLHCSRRTLYELAPSRDELVVLVVDRVLHRIGREASANASREAARIDQLYIFMHTAALGLGSASLDFSRDVGQTPGAQRVFEDHVAYAASLLQAVIERAVVEGEFRAVHAGLAARLLNAGLLMALDPAIIDSTGLTLGEAIDEVARIFGHGLLADPSRMRSRAEAAARTP